MIIALCHGKAHSTNSQGPLSTVPMGERAQPLVAFCNAVSRDLLDKEDKDVRDHVYVEWAKSTYEDVRDA